MQRCPTCEFVYEEDQRFCDMDGMELIHDPEELPRNLPAVRPKLPTKSFPRMIAIVVIPNILLATLLFYGTTQQVVQSSPAPPNGFPEEPAHASELAKEELNERSDPSEEMEHSPSGSVESGVEPSSDGIEPVPSNSLEGRPPIPGGRPISSRSASPGRRSLSRGTPPKKDSKITSVFKKTKRILKKPFNW